MFGWDKNAIKIQTLQVAQGLLLKKKIGTNKVNEDE
jgi:hypothetical protein